MSKDRWKNGCVCSECGTTITEEEYSYGESDCCSAPVAGEEDLLLEFPEEFE